MGLAQSQADRPWLCNSQRPLASVGHNDSLHETTFRPVFSCDAGLPTGVSFPITCPGAAGWVQAAWNTTIDINTANPAASLRDQPSQSHRRGIDSRCITGLHDALACLHRYSRPSTWMVKVLARVSVTMQPRNSLAVIGDRTPMCEATGFIQCFLSSKPGWRSGVGRFSKAA